MGRERYWGRSTRRGTEKESPGCMSGVLHLFDFHLSQFALQHHHQPSFKPGPISPEEDPKNLKGVEAPRNSFESGERDPVMEASSLSEITKRDDLNIRIGIQVKTSSERFSTVESSDSPMAKTPNLVARLMGLDLLPDDLSPSPSTSSIPRKSSSSLRNHLEERNVCEIKRELRPRKTFHGRGSSLVDNNGGRYELTGCHSLPETPRISSARRSDVDPRLSLHINKENLMNNDEFECFTRASSYSSNSFSIKSRKKNGRHEEDQNRSPSHYARQIVKQVKESVSRKVGLDITNITRNRANEGVTVGIPAKKTKGLRQQVGEEASPSKHSTPSCSPRLRFLEPKNKPVTTSIAKDQESHSPKNLSKPPPSQITPLTLPSSSSLYTGNELEPSTKQQNHQQQQQQQKQSAQRCKKGSSERFTQRLKRSSHSSDPETIRNMRQEPFVRAALAKTKTSISDKKCKKTPLQDGFLNVNTVPSFIPIKKESPPSNPSTTKIPPSEVVMKRNSQLSSCSSRTYKQEATQELVDRDTTNTATTPRTSVSSGTGTELGYVSEVLKRTGIGAETLVSFTRWYSPSHPLNPSIFNHLEHSFLDPNTPLGHLSHRCNRKLIFNLVDELLVDILRPYLNLKRWLLPSTDSTIIKHESMKGFQLLDRLCSRIRSFPSSDCKVLEDIDALVEMDLSDATVNGASGLNEEREWFVLQIERDIVDSLLHETAAVMAL